MEEKVLYKEAWEFSCHTGVQIPKGSSIFLSTNQKRDLWGHVILISQSEQRNKYNTRQ